MVTCPVPRTCCREPPPSCREEQSGRAAHAGADDGDLPDAVRRDDIVCRGDVLRLAAVSDLLELSFRFARAGEIEVQRDHAAVGESPAEQDELLALLARAHAVAENGRRLGLRIGTMRDAAEPLPAAVGKRNALLGRH